MTGITKMTQIFHNIDEMEITIDNAGNVTIDLDGVMDILFRRCNVIFTDDPKRGYDTVYAREEQSSK